jgi:hypothetical protein
MGLDDIWGEICRFFIDVSAYLDAGQKAAKYERTAEKLERKIKSCQEKLDDLHTSQSRQSEQYKVNGGSAGNELGAVYEEKVLLWDKKYYGAKKKTEKMLNTARKKAGEAREKAAEWKDRQAQEEADIRRNLWGKQENERQEKEREKKKNKK